MATRKEVALAAGVSESTVTRVVNGGYVSPSVRERVTEVINRLNYRPNALAQGLRTKHTYQIACVVPSIDNPFYSQVMQGVEEVANKSGYVLTMYSSHVVEKNPDRSFFSGRHDALILLSPEEINGWLLKELWEAHMPMVTYWDWGTKSPFPSVSVDLRAGMGKVVDHLVALGHRKIGYISHALSSKDPNPRLTGFKETMAAKGCVVLPHYIQYTSDRGTMTAGYSAMAELYRNYPEITAVVASNDLLAFGVVRWLEDQGLRVPESVSVVGCDDIAYSAMSNPPLTTIQIPKREVGNRLMSLVLSMIEEKQEEETSAAHFELPVRLIVRSSTTNVRVGDL